MFYFQSFGIFEGKPFHEYHNWTDANGGRNSTIPEGETEEEVSVLNIVTFWFNS